MMKQRRTIGFVLMELLVYMGVLAIVVNVVSVAYYRYMRSSLAVQRNTDDILRTTSAGERWRQDVRRASQLSIATITKPSKSTTPMGEILTIQQGEQTVLYRFQKKAMWRRVAGDPDWERILPRVKSSRMLKETRNGVTSWRWEVELISIYEPRVRPLFTFRAVPWKEAAGNSR